VLFRSATGSAAQEQQTREREHDAHPDRGGHRRAALLTFLTDIRALGLQTAQGLTFTEAWYWDLNDANREFASKFAARNKGVYPSMIHAGVLKKIGGYGLIRIGLFILPVGAQVIAPILAVLAIGNVVYAALICLRQKDLKYVVGYSSVSHMGYVILGIAALNLISINGAVMMMFAHGVMSALFFSLIGNLYEKSHTRNIAELGGLAHQMPRLAVGFMLAGLASLGLPGLVNFIGEFTIFVGAFRTYPALTVIAISGIVLTAVYVLRTLGNILFGPRKPEWDHLTDLRGLELVPVIVLGLAIIIPGFFPSTIMDLINNGVGNLVGTLGMSGMIGGGM